MNKGNTTFLLRVWSRDNIPFEFELSDMSWRIHAP